MTCRSDSSTLRIVIIGGGIAGLTAAAAIATRTDLEVIVLERQIDLTEAGAGIQIGPSAVKVLHSLGLRDEMDQIAVFPDEMEVRRWDNGTLICKVFHNAGGIAESMYGSPHAIVHRADLQQLLAKAAKERGADIRMGQHVLRVDCENHAVIMDDGTAISADLIIGADGIWSQTRKSIPENCHVVPMEVHESCYRMLIPRDKMMCYPQTSALATNTRLSLVYAGPHQAVVSYPVARGRLYNVVLPLGKDLGDPPAKYNEPGDLVEMRRQYESFEETVRLLTHLAESCSKWALCELPPLPTWSSKNGRVTLMGDAAHAAVS